MCEVRDLKPNGANILVTEENKKEYVHLVCQMKMTGKTASALCFYKYLVQLMHKVFRETLEGRQLC